jgi:hypothetical protein
MEQISDERVAELLYDLQAPDNEWEGLSALVERHEVVQALDDLQAARETIKALQGGKYYHDLHCNVSRDEPMGCAGCSCYMYQRVAEAEKKIKALGWQKITPENLPNRGDEVLEPGTSTHGPKVIHAVTKWIEWLKFWKWHRHACYTRDDETGIWGECSVCHERFGFVSKAALRRFCDREVAQRVKAEADNAN